MKPLLVLATHECTLTGAPVLALNIVRSLAPLNLFDIFVVSLAGGPLEASFSALCRFQVIGGNAASGPAARELGGILSAFGERIGKIAFCNTIVTADLIPVFAAHGFPVISLVHELPASIWSFGADKFRTIDDNARMIIFGSRFVRDRVSAEFGASNAGIYVVPTGYPNAPLNDEMVQDCRARLRREAAFEEDSFVVLGCGTFQFRKGVDLFIDLAQRVQAQPAGSRIRFAWIGDGSGWGFYHGQVQWLGLGRVLRFLGARPDISPYVPGADLFALTSREDPFPLVSLAAMASGIPVLAFAEAGGAPEAIEDDSGIVVPHLDVAGMADAVLMLAQDRLRREALGAKGRAKFTSRYTMEHFLGGLFRVMRESGIEVPEVRFG